MMCECIWFAYENTIYEEWLGEKGGNWHNRKEASLDIISESIVQSFKLCSVCQLYVNIIERMTFGKKDRHQQDIVAKSGISGTMLCNVKLTLMALCCVA